MVDTFSLMFFSTAVIGITVILLLLDRKDRRRNAVLAAHFGSKQGSSLTIRHRGFQFDLKRVSSGGTSGAATYPRLSVRIMATDKLAIFPDSAKPYLYFLNIPKPHSTIALHGKKVHVVTRDAWRGERIAQVLGADAELGSAVNSLFLKPFASLQVATETHIEVPLPKRVYQLQFIGVDESVYKNPAALTQIMDALVLLLKRLQMAPA